MSGYGPKSYNLDINQLGASQYPRFAVSQTSPYKDGLVEDIILNETHPEYSKEYGTNIGMVKVRLIPEDRGVPSELLNWAVPLDTTLREYPLKNELVLIFYSLGRMFYTRRINATNKITESSWPGLRGKFSPPQTETRKSEDITISAQGGPPYRPWGSRQSETLGDEFAENPTAKMVRPNEGDTIIQGRFGNIIRFGSSLFSNQNTATPEPNLLLTVGQDGNKSVSTKNASAYSLVYEDINKDKSCIWMVTDEEIVLNPATRTSVAHLRSAEISDSTKYTGAQIFVNSDRVILNSKTNEISLFAKTEINLSAVQSITIDSANSVMVTGEKDITLTTPRDIVITGRTISLTGTNDISISTSTSEEAPGNCIISAKKIFIGSGGDESQPIVLGGELAAWLQKLTDVLTIDLIQAFTTLNPSPLLVKLAQLKTQLGLPGVPQSAIFNSTSNFTSKSN